RWWDCVCWGWPTARIGFYGSLLIALFGGGIVTHQTSYSLSPVSPVWGDPCIKTVNMVPILSDITLNEIAVRKLEALPNVTVRQLSPHDSGWDLPDNLLPGPEILLCKLPPRNIDVLSHLKIIQLSSVGYEHLRHFRFAA